MGVAQSYDEKYDTDLTALVVKIQKKRMKKLLEDELNKMIMVEEPQLFEKLKELSVPEEEWPYYAAFFKRCIKTGRKFWNYTFNHEIQLLKVEFEKRGRNPEFLEGVLNVAVEKIKKRRFREELRYREEWAISTAEGRRRYFDEFSPKPYEEDTRRFFEVWSG